MADESPKTKVCTKCRTEKSIAEFRTKGLFRLSSHCNDCQRAYLRDHYKRNKEYYVKKARKRSDAQSEINRTKLVGYLTAHPCVDCGESDPRVLEFDHIHGRKQKAIAEMIRDYPWDQVLAEIEKCEVRCANCHRRRTHEQRGWWKFLSK